MPDEPADTLAAQYLDARRFHTLISGEDVDVLKPDGSLLLALRHRALPADVCREAFLALLRAATPTDNCGMAAGGGGTTGSGPTAPPAAPGGRTWR